MRIPCGEPRNLLKDQKRYWWISVFLKTITSECANIPAFSYLGSSGFHRAVPPKTARPLRGTISCALPDWNKSNLINGLTSPPKELPFFTSSLAPDEGRSCGPAAASRDRQFFRSGPDRGSAARKTLGLIAGFRLTQKSSGVDVPLDSPGGLGMACSVTGDSGPFTGDLGGHLAERYPAPAPDGSAYEGLPGQEGGKLHVHFRIHDRCRRVPATAGHCGAMTSASRRMSASSSLKRRSKIGRSASGPEAS